MDLTQLANLGEFIGGVAVLVTLIYLAVQIRQSNVSARASARQSLIENWSDIQFDLGHHRELLRLLGRGFASFEDLDHAEKTQFIYLMGKYSGNVYNGVLLHEQGLLDEGTLDYIGGLLAIAVRDKGGAVWFRSFPQPPRLTAYVEGYARRAGDERTLEDIMPYWLAPWGDPHP